MPSPARRDLARVSWLPFECRRLRGVGWAHDRGAGWGPDRGAGGPPCRLRHDATWLVSLGCHSSAGDSVAWVGLMTVARVGGLTEAPVDHHAVSGTGRSGSCLLAAIRVPETPWRG